MAIIKTNVNKIKNNPIGAVAGAAAMFFGAKKYAKIQNNYVLVGLAIVGAIAGANASFYFKTRANAPKASDTK